MVPILSHTQDLTRHTVNYFCPVLKGAENIRQRLVTGGFARTLYGEKPLIPPRQKRLDGEQEAQIIALRLGQPPQGFANWSLRLLAEQVVELAIVDAVSHETLRKMLKKTA